MTAEGAEATGGRGSWSCGGGVESKLWCAGKNLAVLCGWEGELDLWVWGGDKWCCEYGVVCC